MDTPGSILKAERERQKKSLEEIARTLKLNIEYLRAIENEKYEVIPAEIYTKAYLRFYAQDLGLDGDQILDLYRKQINVPSIQKPMAQDKKNGLSFKPSLIIITVLLIAAMIFFIERSRETSIETARETTEPDVPEVKTTITRDEMQDVIEPEVSEEKQENMVSEPEVSKEQEAPAAQQNGTLSLTIAATDTTWISVGIDSAGPKEWLLKNGERISLTASEKFVIKIGNAGGTRMIFNGQDLGSLGEYGKVAELVLPKKVAE